MNNLLIILYIIVQCETLLFKLWKKIRLKVFQNKILSQIFGFKRIEIGEWRKLHSKELHSLYHSSSMARVIKSRILRKAGHIARREEGRSAFKISTDKHIGKSLGI